MQNKIVFNKESDLPEMAVSQGSMLVNRTSLWRNMKPVIDYDKCSKCMICWKFCPDVSIDIIDEIPYINYDYCKGCGICAAECPKKAIEMEAEEK
jgi:2-oxoisovalerate ferredoxin oxidoreductase delta subunit